MTSMINARLPFSTALGPDRAPHRTIRTTRWDDATWPPVKAPLARALDMRRQINREGLVELDRGGPQASQTVWRCGGTLWRRDGWCWLASFYHV